MLIVCELIQTYVMPALPHQKQTQILSLTWCSLNSGFTHEKSQYYNEILLRHTLPVKCKLTVTRNSNNSTWSLILKTQKLQECSSQVSRHSRFFENLSWLFQNLSSWVSRLSSRNNSNFHTINFWHVWIWRKAYFSFLYRQIYFEFRSMISLRICLSENSL